MSANEHLLLAVGSLPERYFVKIEGIPTKRGIAALRRHLELLESTLSDAGYDCDHLHGVCRKNDGSECDGSAWG